MKSHVHINIGGFHDWQLLQAHGHVTDGLTVLGGLTFGWIMPTTGICPVQPDPMQATFALNVPSFGDVNDVATGDPVRIEVAFVADDWTTSDAIPDPLFAFYGRVSDVSATPRPGRPGVTLSVVAVDTTVDPADMELWSYPTDNTDAKGYVEVLTQLWADRAPGLGALPDWPILPTNGPDVTVSAGSFQTPLQVINDVLLVAVGDPAFMPHDERVILAPLVDVDFQWYAFDTVRKVPDPADVYVIDGTRIERDTMRWQRLKRSLVNAVEATGSSASGAAGTPAVWPDIGTRVQEEISTICASSDELTTVAQFYLPDPAASGSWTLDTFTLLVSYLDDAALAALPSDLFPRWKDTEGAASRSACYSKGIRLTNLADHSNAFHEDDPGPDLDGILSGATLTITAGRVALALTVRQLQPT